MNENTILLWVAIAIVGIITIIIVKLYFSDDESDDEESSSLSDEDILGDLMPNMENIVPKNNSTPQYDLSPETPGRCHDCFKGNSKSTPRNDDYVTHESSDNDLKNYDYESENKVLINYNNSVAKTQEPMKKTQIDIMTRNNDKTELKDLFTIDELIEESKRKDNAREKESQKIRKEKEDLTEIKESIKNKKENNVEEPLIEEVIEEADKSKDTQTTIKKEIPSITSQKDIDNAIETASREKPEKETKSASEEKNITDVLLNQNEQKQQTEITKPALKTPSKVGEKKDYEFGAPIDDANLFDDDNETEPDMDLDYRNDLNKFTNKIKGSKIFQDVKEKLVSEDDYGDEFIDDETYIRNVNEYDEYDEYEPIINETHIDYDASYDEYHNISYEERLRKSNTKKVFKDVEKAAEIKEKPARDNIKITLNNEEVVLKKGAEIIFNHEGETYSSQVYAIKGDDIHVKYRRKNITISAKDVKKVY